MSYYWFNKQELLQKVGKKYHNCGVKENPAEYYQPNKDVIKEKSNKYNNKYKNLTKEEKEAKKQYSKNSSIINALCSGNEIPKERSHCICIAAICIDSVLKVDKISYPQVYLEQCKYKIKEERQ